MAKFKLCPECGEKNPPNMLECVKCEMDISDVPVTDESEIAAVEQKENAMASTMKVRVCEECGAANPVNARKCKECGEDISYIVPSDFISPACQEAAYFLLNEIGGGFTCKFEEGTSIIGRENLMKEYLAGKAYVSRKHAELVFENGQLFIKDCGATNHSFVNNEMVPVNGMVELHDGDTVSLGGNEINGKKQEKAAYFIVKI